MDEDHNSREDGEEELRYGGSGGCDHLAFKDSIKASAALQLGPGSPKGIEENPYRKLAVLSNPCNGLVFCSEDI